MSVHTLRRFALLALLGVGGVAHATGTPPAAAHPPAAAPAHPPAAAHHGAAHRHKLTPHIEAYVTQHSLAKRVVKVNTPGRDVSRVFVPIVTDAHRADFLERFSRKNGAVLWAQSPTTDYYAKIIVEPTRQYFRNYADNEWSMTHAPTEGHYEVGNKPSRFLAFELDAHHIDGLVHHFDTIKRPSLWKAANPGLELKTSSQGQCMWWMGNAEVGNKKSLWHELGVKRSIAPENLRKKLMHAGNERVSVIGVQVDSIEHFHQMSENDLMGPAPSGGSLEAVKE